jgi:hypothetical protein
VLHPERATGRDAAADGGLTGKKNSLRMPVRLVVIHLTFVVTAVLLAVLDRLERH